MSDASEPIREPQRALFAALASAIAETAPVAKSGNNPEQRYKYAPASAVVAEADRVLTKHGIAVVPISAKIATAGLSESKAGGRTIFVLTVQFLVAHEAGGSLVGEMSIALGANLSGSPPQASSSALTGCERDFYRALLRMPRVDEDDPDHPKNTRERDDEPRQVAKPQAPVPQTRKATLVLRTIAAAKTPVDYEKVREKWDVVLSFRGQPDADGVIDDGGYSDAEAAWISTMLRAAKERVKA